MAPAERFFREDAFGSWDIFFPAERHRLLVRMCLFENVVGSWGMFSYGRRPSEAFCMFLGRHRLLVHSCLFEDAIAPGECFFSEDAFDSWDMFFSRCRPSAPPVCVFV